MRKSRTPGSVRGVSGNGYPYRDNYFAAFIFLQASLRSSGLKHCCGYEKKRLTVKTYVGATPVAVSCNIQITNEFLSRRSLCHPASETFFALPASPSTAASRYAGSTAAA
ncbi:hypothetical protein D4M53_25880 [Klebsiella pneumoniae]|nr:hypothetical protein D4M53_25880 [Klebsiella pneumoniae]